jgi:hypothetical protein
MSVFPAELDIPGASWGTQKSPDTPNDWALLRLARKSYFNSGSRGRPRMRSAMVFRVISDVPPAMVIARFPR